MKEATIEEITQQLQALVEASQHERIVVTWNDKPVAVLIGIEHRDKMRGWRRPQKSGD